jgi:hypothetical protein
MGQSPSSRHQQQESDADEEASSFCASCHWLTQPTAFGPCISCPPPPSFLLQVFSRRRREDLLLSEDRGESNGVVNNEIGPDFDARLQPQYPSSSPIPPLRRRYTIQSLPFAPEPPDTLVSKLVAVDCGMVKVGPRLSKSKRRAQPLALRRVCIVDGRGSILMNEIVRVPPDQESEIEFQTKFGRQISAHLLPRINNSGDDLNKGMSPDEVKRSAAELIRGKIVVGHSVGGDLAALNALHPKHDIRDTALYPPFLNKKGGSHKLIYLAKERLGRNIQEEGNYHACEEDAVASLDLYLSSWDEWEAMSSCSSLPHTHTSRCNLRGGDLSFCSDSRIVNSTSGTVKNIAKQDKKRVTRKESRRRRKQRRKGRSQNDEVLVKPKVPDHQSVGQFRSYVTAAAGDISKLFIEGLRRTCKYVLMKSGYQTVPRPFIKTRDLKKRWKERQRYYRRRRSRLRHLFVSLQNAILISHVVVEPMVFCMIYQAQRIGIVVPLRGIGIFEREFNQLGFISSLVGASVLAATDRHSVQSRICLGILCYYHAIYLSHCTGDLKGLSLSVVAAANVDGSYLYLVLYHFGFYLYFPMGWACKKLEYDV